jgi:hypothetical protein
MIKHFLAALMLAAAAFAAVPGRAANDPSSQQIDQAARAGNMGRAQAMIDQVLKDHPQSGKAHYVAAQLAAREGRLAAARAELSRAETLAPGLPFAQPRSVSALRARLDPPSIPTRAGARAPRHRFPWGGVLLLGAIVVIVLSLLRRRAPNPAYGTTVSPVGPSGAATPGGPFAGPYGGPGTYGPGPYGAVPPAGGIGSGIVGGLASGLGIGAGVVAGEELAHHLFNGGQPAAPGGFGAGSGDSLADPGPSNADMGGNDFGITNDPGSWDDGGGADAGGDGWS